MTEKNDDVPEIPEELRGLFGDPPLLPGEDPKLYQSLLRGLINERKPATITDWIALLDLLTALWEEQRLRRASTGIIRAGVLPALTRFANDIFWHDFPFPPDAIPQVTAVQYFSGTLNERTVIKSQLARYGITEVEIQARGAQLNSDALQMFEDMITSRERKRRRLRKEDRQSSRERRKNKESSGED